MQNVTSPILVTGGTGTLGRQIVEKLHDTGYAVRILSRKQRATDNGVQFVTGDLATGQGAEAAVEGVEIIVHCAGTNKGDEDKTRYLVEAAKRAGARHLVYISVVGADRVPLASGIDRTMFAYFGSKHAAERVVAESELAWTTLRATQFHDLTLMTARQMAKLPVIPVPSGFRFQPVETEEVAQRLVDLALGEPSGLVADIAGPRVYSMADLVRSYVHARHLRRAIMPIWIPGKAAGAIRAGANLAPDHACGHRTWEEFLATHVG